MSIGNVNKSIEVGRIAEESLAVNSECMLNFVQQLKLDLCDDPNRQAVHEIPEMLAVYSGENGA